MARSVDSKTLLSTQPPERTAAGADWNIKEKKKEFVYNNNNKKGIKCEEFPLRSSHYKRLILFYFFFFEKNTYRRETLMFFPLLSWRKMEKRILQGNGRNQRTKHSNLYLNETKWFRCSAWPHKHRPSSQRLTLNSVGLNVLIK